ncbi:unnamed protein product [Peniophora sp. CBMAI 1063]|nr:unnamed protein product [Peniophora sp. CBMAI 1063]
MDSDDEEVDPTYGERAPYHIATLTLNASQIQKLEPRIDDYVILDGQERTAFALESFRLVWEGEEIEWEIRSLWPSKAVNPKWHREKQAVNNFFKERLRMRRTVLRLPGEKKKSWNEMDVCGDVYEDAIVDLCNELTGLAAGSKDGWIAEYPKARAAIYYSLTDEEREAIQTLCESWNRTGIPKGMKKKKNAKHCKKFLLNCAQKCLQVYGVYPFIFAIGEPGTEIKSKVYDFSRELGLGDEVVEDRTPMDDTLAVFRNHVTTKVGASDPVTKKAKKPARAFDELTCYDFDPKDFMGGDAVRLRQEDWNEEAFFAQRLQLLHAIFRMGHANITSRDPRALQPPWTYLSDGELLDLKHFPEGIKMTDPGKLRDDDKMKVLRHLFFEVGEVCFKAYKLRGTTPRPPVDLEARWWALSPEMAAFEKAKEKALNARPIYRAGAREQSGAREGSTAHGGPADPEGGPGADGGVSSAGGSLATAGGVTSTGPSAAAKSGRRGQSTVRSLYGSSRRQRVHNEENWQEDNLIDPPSFVTIPDPDDYYVKQSSAPPNDNGWPVPAFVPSNGEARSQWAYDILDILVDDERTPGFVLRRCITLLVELPLVRNHGYPVGPFRKHKMQPNLPKFVDWKADSFRGPTSAVEVAELETYLRASPWTFSHQGSVLYSGSEMAWCFILAFLLYLRSASRSAEFCTMEYVELKRIGETFKHYLEKATEDNYYPGTAPSRKYEIASSRLAYLCTVFNMHYELVQLLALAQHLPVHTDGSSPVVLPGTSDFPSWQSPRLGLPLACHQSTDSVLRIKTWLRSPNLFVNSATGLPISREIALQHLLVMACTQADLESIVNEDWDKLGHLQQSKLRGSARELLDLLYTQADSHVDILQGLGLDEEEIAGSEERQEARGDDAEVGLAGSIAEEHRGGPAEPHRGAAPPGFRNSLSGRKVAGQSLPPPELLEAARRTNKEGNRLQEFIQHATSRPGTAAEVNQQLAFELHAREQERMARNRDLRAQSRADTSQPISGRSRGSLSSTRPASLPELPVPVDFSLLDEDIVPPVEKATTRKRKQPTYHQPIQRSSRTGKSDSNSKSMGAVPGLKEKQQRKAKRKKKAPAIGRPKKRVRPSARKRAEEPEDEDARGGSEELEHIDLPEFQSGLSDTEESDENITLPGSESNEGDDTDASERYAPRPTKRRRLDRDSGTSATDPSRKPPSRVVEVLLTPRKRVSSSPAPTPVAKARPKPKMVRKPKPVLKPSSSTGSTRRSQTPGKTVHFDTPVSTPRRSSRLSGDP